MQPATATDTSAHTTTDIECTPDAPCVACLAAGCRAVPANDATAQKAPRSTAKRWTWKRLHREVFGHCAMANDADAALAHVYVIEDNRANLEHTMVATIDLFRSIAVGTVASAERMLEDSENRQSPPVVAIMAGSLRQRAELLAGIATVLENHADEMARKQGAGL